MAGPCVKFRAPRRPFAQSAIAVSGQSRSARRPIPIRSNNRATSCGDRSDRASVVPARLLRSGIPVIAQGRGDGTIDVRPLEVGRNPFKRGDIIITSGTGGLYPPLVPVARVVKLDDDGAVAVPLADPATTSFAMVEPPFEPAATSADGTTAPSDAPKWFARLWDPRGARFGAAPRLSPPIFPLRLS